MPYVIAIALLNGEITVGSYAEKNFTDRAVVDLMNKIKVAESAQMSAQYPESVPARVSITMASGEVLVREMRYPHGHAKSPMDDRQLEEKFRELSRGRCDAGQCEKILQDLWKFEQVADIEKDVIRLLGA
jgi:2-methylcitrate dehydratase